MRNSILVLLLLLGLLLTKAAAISNATNRNLETLSFLEAWAAEPKGLSQIICGQTTQEADSTDATQARLTSADRRPVLINAARKAYFAGDCARASAYWMLALEKDPHDSSASLMRYLSSGLDKELFPANISDEEMASYLFGLGLLANDYKLENQAKFWFTNSLEIQPSRAVADRLALILQSADEQEYVWRKLAEGLTEDDEDYWWARGQQAEQDQHWVPALEAYNAGAAIAPDPYRYLMKQGLLLMKLDRLGEAEVAFKEGNLLKPDRSQPLLYLGNIYRSRGDQVAARAWYEQAVELAPDGFFQNYNLGLAYYDLNNHRLADQYLSKASEIDPQNHLAIYYLAQAVYRNGQVEKAQALLDEAVFLDEGRHWEWLVTLGDWRNAANDHEGALEAYHQALDLQPGNSKIVGKIQESKNP